MTVAWTAGDDFEQAVDTLEEVVVRPRECADALSTVGWRFSEELTEVEGSKGAVRAVESVWQLPIPEGGVYSPGDRLVDVSGRRHILTSVARLRGGTRLRCSARRLEFSPLAAEWFDLERGESPAPAPPVAPVAWSLERGAIRGVAYRTATVDAGAESAPVERYRVVLDEPVVATPLHRFRTHAGVIYRVIPQAYSDPLGAGWGYLADRSETP